MGASAVCMWFCLGAKNKSSLKQMNLNRGSTDTSPQKLCNICDLGCSDPPSVQSVSGSLTNSSGGILGGIDINDIIGTYVATESHGEVF